MEDFSMSSIANDPAVTPAMAGNGHGKKSKETGRAAPPADVQPSDLPVRTQLKQLLKTVKAVRQGDFTVRFPEGEGLVSEIGEVLNDIIELNEDMSREFVRVSKIVGR